MNECGLSSRGDGDFRLKLLAISLGVVAGLLLVELVSRVALRTLLQFRDRDSPRLAVVDPLVGHIPKPALSLRLPNGAAVTIEEHGTRGNGPTPARAERPLVLAVGDSFAFGDEVDDEDSWPAVLERLTGGRVINGAVPGLGFDQIVLRAEQLAAIYAPDVIVVSFIPHDVLRCEMSYWSGNAKPYFEIDDGALQLHAAPPPRSWLAPLKPYLAMSAAMRLLFPRFLRWEGPYEEIVHRQGREVACLLMERLAALGRARGARVVVLAQPQEASAPQDQVDIKDGTLVCARANDLATLDLFPVLDRMTPEQRERLFRNHMTPEGNRVVAEELSRFLGGVPSTPG